MKQEACYYLALAAAIVLTFSVDAEEVKTYSLADFGMESVEPGFTVLSETYDNTYLPSKTHINGPPVNHHFKNGFTFFQYPMDFETVVGPVELFLNCAEGLAAPKERFEGKICLEIAATGCSAHVFASNAKSKGALAYVNLNDLPFAGAGAKAKDTNDFVADNYLDGFASIGVDGFARIGLLAAIASGNETIVAVRANDNNYVIEDNLKPFWHSLYYIVLLLVVAEIVFAISLRKKMHEVDMVNYKKSVRTIASTCIEIEIFLGFYRFLSCLESFTAFIMSWPVFKLFEEPDGDIANVTTLLLLVFWYNMSSGGMKAKKQVFVSKAGIYLVVVVSIISMTGTMFALFPAMSFGGTDSGIQEFSSLILLYKMVTNMIWATAYVYVGARFYIFVRKSTLSASGGSMDEAKKKMLGGMLGYMVACAGTMYFQSIFQGWLVSPLSGSYLFTVPGGYYHYTRVFKTSTLVVSYLQLQCFGKPTLRKWKELNKKNSAGSTNVSKSSSSGGASSSGVSSSSGASSSGASTSAASSSN